MKNSGYTEVGRYLTNTPGGTLDKKMTPEEIEVIRDAGLKIFPIFQTYGGEASYFTRSQGSDDAATAVAAAKKPGLSPRDYDLFRRRLRCSGSRHGYPYHSIFLRYSG
ncbi:MAG: glycoside hydrolase domain-containing protein [Lachnospiraceae bacterium]